MDPSAPADRYPALAVQRGMVLGTLHRPDGGVDILQVTIDWGEPLDRAAFTATWRAAVARHPALRTSFLIHGDDGLVQVVAPAVEPDLRWRAARGEDFLAADRFEPFDVGRAPLFRVTVLGGSQAVLTCHHAILDGRSLRLLLDEVLAGYAALRAGRPSRHPRRPPFADFVRWWQAADLGAAEAFWRAYLGGAPALRSLPGFLGDGDDGDAIAQPATDETGLTKDESDRVRALAAELGASPGTVVNAAWALLRGAYGGTDDVTFAVTRSCRYGSIPGADDIIGMLITTVPLRIRLASRWTVRELVSDVAARTRAVRDHQLAPLASILGWTDLPPLDSLVIFERERLHTALVRLEPDAARASMRIHRLPGFPLTLYAFDEPELRMAAMWDGRRVLSASARHMLGRLRDTLRQLAGRPDAYLSDGPRWPDHQVRLTGDWALWRTVCLRGAGFPVDLLSALGDEELARAADAANAAGDGTEAGYAAEFPRAVRRLGHALRSAAARPAFREAVTWQNPHALATGVDVLRRRDPGQVARNAKHRQHETLVASYLQRYCAKNDTIGFFGPVGWARFCPGEGVRVDHVRPPALVSARTTYLEG